MPQKTCNAVELQDLSAARIARCRIFLIFRRESKPPARLHVPEVRRLSDLRERDAKINQMGSAHIIVGNGKSLHPTLVFVQQAN
jgi:hypothetical protein